MNKEQIARLTKLADHLKSKKLSVDKFDFRSWREENCKSTACAIGECPAVFPKYWKKGPSKKEIIEGRPIQVFFPRLMNDPNDGMNSSIPHSAAERFFGLTSSEVNHLFYPNYQDTQVYGGRQLSDNATALQVANNIYAFLERKKKHEAIKARVALLKKTAYKLERSAKVAQALRDRYLSRRDRIINKSMRLVDQLPTEE